MMSKRKLISRRAAATLRSRTLNIRPICSYTPTINVCKELPCPKKPSDAPRVPPNEVTLIYRIIILRACEATNQAAMGLVVLDKQLCPQKLSPYVWICLSAKYSIG